LPTPIETAELDGTALCASSSPRDWLQPASAATVRATADVAKATRRIRLGLTKPNVTAPEGTVNRCRSQQT